MQKRNVVYRLDKWWYILYDGVRLNERGDGMSEQLTDIEIAGRIQTVLKNKRSLRTAAKELGMDRRDMMRAIDRAGYKLVTVSKLELKTEPSESEPKQSA